MATGADGGMRDAQSMLDQLVSFCGDSINEADVLDVFGFTSREKVVSLTQTLLARNHPAALSLIQKEAESGRELSQLLGELIGCLRALLVAQLDPSADGDGIPAHLWKVLREAADEYPPDRILSAIDVFAETESRMKWATNKRLHFELGVIKAIQSLSEVRITDVIKVLARSAEFSVAPVAVPKATESPVVVAEISNPISEPKPEPKKTAKKAGLSSLDSMINAAPEISTTLSTAETAPWKDATPVLEEVPLKPTPTAEDTFHNDPLIQAALVKFEGKVLG